MPKMPFSTLCTVPRLPLTGRIPSRLLLLPSSPSSVVTAAAGSRLMATCAKFPCHEDGGEAVDLRSFPTPLSPPYPPLSKGVELHRAMSAASRSGLFALSDTNIVYEDSWLVVLNKPSGVYCEVLLSAYSELARASSSSSSSSGGQESSGGGAAAPELHLANRLDRDTSGLVVMTKSHKAAAKLVKAFTDHRVKKTYIAFCTGRVPSWKQIRIVSGHGRSKFGAWRVYAASDVGRTLPGGSTVRHMATSFEVLSVNGRGEYRESTDGHTAVETLVVEEKAVAAADGDTEAGEGSKTNEILMRARPESGRTHQIRLHCQYLGLPIRGDVKYGGICEWEGTACEAHALHAESLQFEHPVTGLPLQFHAPPPPWACEAPDSMTSKTQVLVQ